MHLQRVEARREEDLFAVVLVSERVPVRDAGIALRGMVLLGMPVVQALPTVFRAVCQRTKDAEWIESWVTAVTMSNSPAVRVLDQFLGDDAPSGRHRSARKILRPHRCSHARRIHLRVDDSAQRTLPGSRRHPGKVRLHRDRRCSYGSRRYERTNERGPEALHDLFLESPSLTKKKKFARNNGRLEKDQSITSLEFHVERNESTYIRCSSLMCLTRPVDLFFIDDIHDESDLPSRKAVAGVRESTAATLLQSGQRKPHDKEKTFGQKS